MIKTSGFFPTGSGDFKIAITNSSGTTYYWTNDGSTPTPPDAPTGSLMITITRGFFTIILGDATPGMENLPASLFAATDEDRYIRIWYNGTRATPDLLITDSAYSTRIRP